MREIKFRAWSNQYKIWWEVVTINFSTQEVLLPDGEWYHYDILFQFTGLLDKRGEEIYEGDVIEWESSGEKSRMVMEVKRDKLGCQVRTIPYINATSEVIGNIYENPELLSDN